MNILMLTSRMDIGGAETHIYTLSKELKALGHEVFCASAGGRTAKELRSIGVPHFTLPLDKKTPDALLVSYRAIRSIIKKYNVNVVHAHSRIPALIADRIKKSRCGESFTFVTTAHLPFRSTPFLRKISAWGERCICVSEDIREYLRCEYNVPSRKTTVIENGIDTSRFRPATAQEKQKMRTHLGIDSRAFVICSAQRSSESRAALPLFMAEHAKELCSRSEVLLLLLSGAVGEERDMSAEIRAAADRANAELGRRAVIIVEGKADVSPYLDASDVFVGVSRAAEEAMCASLPVIIAGNDGYGGILTKSNADKLSRANLTGRGCEAGFSSLADDIKALKNTRVRAFCSSFCLSFARERFSSQKMCEMTVHFYEEALCIKKNKDLLIIGHYGASNIGDDAVCSILSERFSDEYNLHFVCKNKTALAAVTDAHGISRTDIRGILSAAKRSDAVIFGAGNLMQDDTSNRSLHYYKFLLGLVRRHTPRLAIFANGIGPIRSERNEQVVCEMVGCADYISMRERVSTEYAKRLTLRNDINCAADIVYLARGKAVTASPAPLAPTRAKASVIRGTESDLSGAHAVPQPSVNTGIMRELNGKRYFVICPRQNTDKKTLEALAAHLKSADSRGLCAVIVAMQDTQDVPVSQSLHAQIPNSIIITSQFDATELLQILMTAEYCIGGRLHAGILSICASCPFVGYDSDDRIKHNLSYAGVGAYLRAGSFDSDTLSSAIERERNAVANGRYKCARENLALLAERELDSLCEFIKS